MIAVSICGGITHNLGRILVAMVVVKNYYIFGYFPFLLSVAGSRDFDRTFSPGNLYENKTFYKMMERLCIPIFQVSWLK